MSTITHTAAFSWAAAHRILMVVLVAVVAAVLVAAATSLVGARQDAGAQPIQNDYAPAAQPDPCGNARATQVVAC